MPNPARSGARGAAPHTRSRPLAEHLADLLQGLEEPQSHATCSETKQFGDLRRLEPFAPEAEGLAELRRESSGQPVEDEAAFVDSMMNVSISPRVAAWAADAVDLLAERDEASTEGVRRAAEEQIQSVDLQIDRLTDLVVQGHIDTTEFERRKVRLTTHRLELEDRRETPAQTLADWRTKLQEALRLLTGLSTAFANATFDERRQLLALLYENSQVKAREPEPRLRFPFTRFEEPPTDDVLPPDGDENRRAIIEVELNQQKNGPSLESDLSPFLSWCTHQDSNLGPSQCQCDALTN